LFKCKTYINSEKQHSTDSQWIPLWTHSIDQPLMCCKLNFSHHNTRYFDIPLCSVQHPIILLLFPARFDISISW
jgi:hypothetical protein